MYWIYDLRIHLLFFKRTMEHLFLILLSDIPPGQALFLALVFGGACVFSFHIKEEQE